jgi:hypothetical protein
MGEDWSDDGGELGDEEQGGEEGEGEGGSGRGRGAASRRRGWRGGAVGARGEEDADGDTAMADTDY